MSNFTVNTHRADPYKNFKFRLKWDGRYVAGFSKASALKSRTDIVDHRDGGDPSTRRSPDLWKFEPITLERGVTHDADFENWANGLHSARGASLVPKNLHKDLILELIDESGKVAHAYKIRRCWVSKWIGQSDLDANANALAIEHITLENEGWETESGSS